MAYKMTKEEIREELDCIKMCFEEALATATKKQSFNPYGHMFVWGYINLPNGKRYKTLLGYLNGTTGVNEILAEATQAVPEVTDVWTNLD